jgi:hypothetical protein
MEFGAKLLKREFHDAEDGAARTRTLEGGLNLEGTCSEQDGVGVSAKEIHEPTVLFGLRDVPAGGVTSQKRDYAVERLDEVGEDPWAIRRRLREAKSSVGRVDRVEQFGAPAMVEEYLEVAHR